jgi:ubiquinone/menaquinone biosynthesis C-methylase UbiE
MNRLHQWLCASQAWSRHARRTLVPWVTGSFDLGGHVLEIGPGYGPTTAALTESVQRLTALEADEELANRLGGRLEDVTVVHGDGAAMPFADGSYSAVVCFTMLHHLPSARQQDRLFTEAFRVLRPGGVFAGTDSRSSLAFRLIHVSDTMVAVDPGTLAERLSAAGFTQVRIDTRHGSFRFGARKLYEAA